jgi:hypothetical protein
MASNNDRQDTFVITADAAPVLQVGIIDGSSTSIASLGYAMMRWCQRS